MNENALVYVADERFLAPSIVSCLSFTHKSLDNVDRYIFVCTKSDELIQQARKYVAQYSQAICIVKIELAGVDGFSLQPHISASAYGRLFLHQWLKEDYKRVLYLDGDTLSGSRPFDIGTDLSGNVFGAVEDIGVVHTGNANELLHNVNSNQKSQYFNSGVLLIDWAKWIDQEFGEKAMFFMNRNPTVTYGDQCALNNVCVGNWKPLHPSWNTHTPMLNDNNLINNAKIFHFIGSVKPWHGDVWLGNMTYTKPYFAVMENMPFETGYRKYSLRSRVRRIGRIMERPFRRNNPKKWTSWVAENYERLD